MDGLLLVDKPAGWTSMQVDRKVKNLARMKRVGHLGTLDPIATGILPVFLGRATRLIPYFEDGEKEYEVGGMLGMTTDTWDSDGKIVSEDRPHVTREEVMDVLSSFRGELDQEPPPISAKLFKGERFYDIARSGRQVPKRVVSVHVYEIDLIHFSEEAGTFRLKVRCSKGTYTRSIVHGIGVRLGCGAVQAGLRRTRSGPFAAQEALAWSAIEDAAQKDSFSTLLIPMSSILSVPKVTMDPRGVYRLRHGQRVSIRPPVGVRSYDRIQIVSNEEELIAVGWYLPNQTVKPDRVLV